MEMFFGFVLGLWVGLVAMNHLWEDKVKNQPKDNHAPTE
jgi:hypothetical protein